jgi:hypothetical protein
VVVFMCEATIIQQAFSVLGSRTSFLRQEFTLMWRGGQGVHSIVDYQFQGCLFKLA